MPCVQSPEVGKKHPQNPQVLWQRCSASFMLRCFNVLISKMWCCSKSLSRSRPKSHWFPWHICGAAAKAVLPMPPWAFRMPRGGHMRLRVGRGLAGRCGDQKPTLATWLFTPPNVSNWGVWPIAIFYNVKLGLIIPAGLNNLNCPPKKM